MCSLPFMATCVRVEAEHYLAALLPRLPRLHKQGLCGDGALRCQPLVAQGDPATVSRITVAGIGALVVMATHGRSGLVRWALGSVADRVARGGAAAVLLVRDGAQPPGQRAVG